MDERAMRTSAKTVVIRDGKLLAVRLRDEDGEFYILPGGGQNAGELLPDAVTEGEAMEPGTLFASFYETQNGVSMDDDMQAYMDTLIAQIFGEDDAT